MRPLADRRRVRRTRHRVRRPALGGRPTGARWQQLSPRPPRGRAPVDTDPERGPQHRLRRRRAEEDHDGRVDGADLRLEPRVTRDDLRAQRLLVDAPRAAVGTREFEVLDRVGDVGQLPVDVRLRQSTIQERTRRADEGLCPSILLIPGCSPMSIMRADGVPAPNTVFSAGSTGRIPGNCGRRRRERGDRRTRARRCLRRETSGPCLRWYPPRTR